MITIPISNARQLIKDFGTCLSMNGSAGSLTLGTSNPFTGDFYISMWVKWSGINGSYQTLFAKRDSYAADGLMFSLAVNDTGTSIILDTVTSFITFGYIFPKNKWVHMTWVHSTTASKDKLYINGDLITSSNISTLGTKTNALISIGSCQSPAIDVFNGKMDEICIGTYSPTDYEAYYFKSRYDYISEWSYLKLDEGSGSTATDSSGNGNNGTITTFSYATDKVIGARTAATNRPIVYSNNKSMEFTGASTSKLSTTLTASTTGFCFAVRFKLLAYPSGQAKFLVNYQGTTSVGGFSLQMANGATILNLVMNNGATGVASISSTTIPLNQWHTVVVTYVPNSLKLFLDGIQQGVTDTSCTMTAPDPAQGVCISGKSNGSGNTFNARIDDFIFENTATPWSQSYINSIKTANYFPTSPSLVVNFNDNVTDQSGNGILCTPVLGTYVSDSTFQNRQAV